MGCGHNMIQLASRRTKESAMPGSRERLFVSRHLRKLAEVEHGT
jgi:hypothetical protein